MKSVITLVGALLVLAFLVMPGYSRFTLSGGLFLDGIFGFGYHGKWNLGEPGQYRWR